MDHFQLTIVVMAVTGAPWERREADGRRRQWTAEELDALVDFDWPWTGVKGGLAACANVVRSFWQPRAHNRIDALPLPSVE